MVFEIGYVWHMLDILQFILVTCDQLLLSQYHKYKFRVNSIVTNLQC